MIKVNIDTSEADAALGFINGMATAISTDRYISSVTNYAHGEMAKAFDEQIDIVAMGNREGFNHVYEARRLGLPSGHLWRHRIQGGGRYNKIASFEFLPSTEPILRPSERRDDTSDPMSGVPDDAFAKLKQRNYTFINKATVMEYGLTTVVRPTQAKRLFVPTTYGRGYRFSKATPQNWRRGNPQDSSGGVGTLGRFTTFWTEWWNTEAPAIWDTQIKTTIEMDLGKCQREMLKITKGRRRGKTFKMSVFDAAADFEAGSNMAMGTIEKQRMTYAQASKYIDRAWAK